MKELVPVDEKAVSDFLNDNLGKDLIAPFFKETEADAEERGGRSDAAAAATPDNVLPSPGVRLPSGGRNRLSEFGSATPSFARRVSTLSSPFMLSSSISPFANVSPRSAFQLGGDVASTPARPTFSSQLHPRGVNPVAALGSLSAFSTPSPASAFSSSSFSATPSSLPRFSPSSIAASITRSQLPQLSSISALSTPSSISQSYRGSRGTPSFAVQSVAAQPSGLGGSPSLKQMFSDMAAIYEETFIMPSQTLAKSFAIDNAIPLLAIKETAIKPTRATAPVETNKDAEPKPKKEKRERNYWEEDDEEEAEEIAAGAGDTEGNGEAGFNDQPSDGDQGIEEEGEEIPDQMLTAFFTETLVEEGTRPSSDAAVSVHLTAFHSSAPMPSSLQDALGGDASFSFSDDTSTTPSPKRYVWLLRKRYHFNRHHRRRQGLEEPINSHDEAAKRDGDYSVGVLRLPRDNADVMHLSFYNKDTLAVLSCATTINVEHSIDPLSEPEGVVETLLELLPITDVTFVPVPDRCQLSSGRMSLSFTASVPRECKSRLQPPNAAGAAVSGTRNVAAVYAAPKRLLFYDLLDEEEEEEEEDEGEEEGAEEDEEAVAEEANAALCDEDEDENGTHEEESASRESSFMHE